MGAVKTIAILMATLKTAASAYAAAQDRYRDAYDTLREAGVDRPDHNTTAATISDEMLLTYAELIAADNARSVALTAVWDAERAVAKAING